MVSETTPMVLAKGHNARWPLISLTLLWPSSRVGEDLHSGLQASRVDCSGCRGSGVDVPQEVRANLPRESRSWALSTC